MTRKPLTVVDVTKLDWNQLTMLWRAGFDVAQEMASRPEARGPEWMPRPYGAMPHVHPMGQF